MLRDFVYAFRVLRKSPLATAVTILALALGIGANIGSFLAVNAILLHPFPYPQLDRIMTVWGTLPKNGLNRAGVTAADFEDWKLQNRSFEALAIYDRWTVSITGGDRPEPVQGARVGADFFETFGMKPSLGRTFAKGEMESQARVAVLSHGFWRARFASAPDVAGKTISLGGQSYKILGVMPDDFDYPLAAEVWVPLFLSPAEKADRSAHSFLVVGRLKPDASAAQADAEIRTFMATREQEYPKTNTGWSAAVAPFREIGEATTNRFVEVLFIASLFLLLLAGANVANIQLAQAMNRRKTIVIEASLGASRFRIARSLCVQSLLVAIAGGTAALIAAVWMNDVNRASIPATVYQIVPGLRHMRVDSTVVLFTLALSLLTGILCSLPAIGHLLSKGSAPSLTESLSEGSRTAAGDLRHRMRDLLVIGEMAMALVLLVGAGVIVKTFQRMLQLDLGFNQSELLTAQISLTKQAYPDDTQIAGFYDRLLPELSTIPNVRSASLEMNMGTASDFRIEGRPDPVAGDAKPAIRIVDARYFRTMEMPIISGRGISQQDTADSTRVIVVSKSIAEHYWLGSDPIGHRVRFGQSPWLTVVGVSGDTMQWFTNTPEPAVYTSYWQKPILNARVLLRTSGDPTLAGNAVVAKVHGVDPNESVYQIKSMEQYYSDERSGVQAAASMMKNNAAIALFLALTGIYGVISYFVSQRTREIGIRIAVGAETFDIIRMTLGEACRLAGIGFAVGVPAAYLLTRALSSALYNVVVVDWATFSALSALLAVAALLAAYIPARRAAAVDPVIALRNV